MSKSYNLIHSLNCKIFMFDKNLKKKWKYLVEKDKLKRFWFFLWSTECMDSIFYLWSPKKLGRKKIMKI